MMMQSIFFVAFFLQNICIGLNFIHPKMGNCIVDVVQKDNTKSENRAIKINSAVVMVNSDKLYSSYKIYNKILKK